MTCELSSNIIGLKCETHVYPIVSKSMVYINDIRYVNIFHNAVVLYDYKHMNGNREFQLNQNFACIM